LLQRAYVQYYFRVIVWTEPTMSVPSADSVVIAPFWRRALSCGIDVLLIGALFLASVYGAHQFRWDHAALMQWLPIGLIFCYEVVVPLACGGMTPGRFAARIRLVKEDGRTKAGLLALAARLLTRLALYALFAVLVAYELDLGSFVFVLAVETLACAFQRRRQTLADLVGRTVVVTAAKAGQPASVAG